MNWPSSCSRVWLMPIVPCYVELDGGDCSAPLVGAEHEQGVGQSRRVPRNGDLSAQSARRGPAAGKPLPAGGRRLPPGGLAFGQSGKDLRPYGDMAHTPIYVHVMQALGLMMMLIFAHVVFTYFRRLKQAVAAEDWKSGAMQLAQIRRWIGMNLILGLLVVSAASGGRLVM